MALVRRIRLHSAGSFDERLDRARVPGWHGFHISRRYRGVASLARVSLGSRTCVIFADCGSMAYSGRLSQYWRTRWPRLLLVLLRQRTFPKIPRKALPARLQQAPLGTVLVSASGMALPLEFVSTRGYSNHHRRPEGTPRRLLRAHPTALLDSRRPHSRLLRDLHESGVLHFSRLSAPVDADRRRSCAQ